MWEKGAVVFGIRGSGPHHLVPLKHNREVYSRRSQGKLAPSRPLPESPAKSSQVRRITLFPPLLLLGVTGQEESLRFQEGNTWVTQCSLALGALRGLLHTSMKSQVPWGQKLLGAELTRVGMFQEA